MSRRRTGARAGRAVHAARMRPARAARARAATDRQGAPSETHAPRRVRSRPGLVLSCAACQQVRLRCAAALRRAAILCAALLVAATLGAAALWASIPDPAPLARENPRAPPPSSSSGAPRRGRKGRAFRPRQSVGPARARLAALLEARCSSRRTRTSSGTRASTGRRCRRRREHDLERGRFARGASTITQQLAKNLWFGTEKSLWRKAKEAIARGEARARALEAAHPRALRQRRRVRTTACSGSRRARARGSAPARPASPPRRRW